ncbi:MAG: hypothetical protein ABJG88_09505 [Litorimonas sp.]
MRLFFIVICSFFLASCASSGDTVAPETIKNVKYFQTKPYDPEPGVEYVRLTALVSGRLNIKNDCLMIGPHVPVFSNDLVIARDSRGLFIQHETGRKKFRIGQKITGGGGYSSKFRAKPDFVYFKNGATPDLCKPQKYRWLRETETGSYVSFYLSGT